MNEIEAHLNPERPTNRLTFAEVEDAVVEDAGMDDADADDAGADDAGVDYANGRFYEKS